MTEAEVCSYLWNREPDSIARRCLAVICKFLFPGVSTKRSKRNTEHTLIQQGLQACPQTLLPPRPSKATGVPCPPETAGALRQALVERRIDKADEVSAEFREFSAIVRPLGPEHHAMADLLLLFANTKRSGPRCPAVSSAVLCADVTIMSVLRWFRSSNIETFRSPPVSFDDDDRVPKSLIEKMGQVALLARARTQKAEEILF